MQALRHWRVNVILNHMSQIVHVGIKLLIQSNSMRHSPIIIAVNTRTVLAIVPPQGCEAILVEILQSKRSAGGPHFTCCFLKSE